MKTSAIRRRVTGRVLALSAGIAFVDQFSKALAARLPEHQATGVFLPLRNPEFLLGIAGTSTALMALAATAGIVLFGGFAYRSALRGHLSAAIPGLLLGGALSNLIDRIFLGSVRDFIATPWIVFNLADLAVAAGLCGFVLTYAMRRRRA